MDALLAQLSFRIGDVEATTLGEFGAAVAAALPDTPRGVLVAGDRDRPVRRVAVAGGAGDFLLGDVLGSDADCFVTSDLRHHPAMEFVEQGRAALVDVSHWAAEWTWLPQVEQRLLSTLDTVETRVSTICTDAYMPGRSSPCGFLSSASTGIVRVASSSA